MAWLGQYGPLDLQCYLSSLQWDSQVHPRIALSQFASMYLPGKQQTVRVQILSMNQNVNDKGLHPSRLGMAFSVVWMMHGFNEQLRNRAMQQIQVSSYKYPDGIEGFWLC